MRMFKFSHTKINKYKKGFTLIELMVVISIISLLASIILTSVDSAKSKAMDSKLLQEAKQVVLALNEYYAANGAWPHVPGNGSGSYNCLAPSSVTCWGGYAQGSDALVTMMQPYMSSFPVVNISGVNSFRYEDNFYAGYFGAGSPAGAWLDWEQVGSISTSECPSPSIIENIGTYYICDEYLGPP